MENEIDQLQTVCGKYSVYWRYAPYNNPKNTYTDRVNVQRRAYFEDALENGGWATQRLLPLFVCLGKLCKHITEFGVYEGVSTVAWLEAQPDKLICYDIDVLPVAKRLLTCADKTDFQIHEADVRQIVIEPTELLFIDTWHVYEQLKIELALHHDKVSKWILMHDTSPGVMGVTPPEPGHDGLLPAIDEFLAAHPEWRKAWDWDFSCGLTLLERVK